jgi:primosomal protein N' (replication factor Y) (superfamily II helicase)
MPSFVRVLVDRSEGRELDYEIPECFLSLVAVGSRVIIPVRGRRAIGTVLELLDQSAVPGIKPIESVVEPEAATSPALMKLGRWMADYYCAPLASVMRSILPPTIRGEKIAGKKIRMAGLSKKLSVEEIDHFIKKAPKRGALLRALAESSDRISVAELLASSGSSESSLRALIASGYVDLEQKRVYSSGNGRDSVLPGKIPELNPDQRRVVGELLDAVACPEEKKGRNPFLLHGVTGSGKTEVYLRLLAKVLESGRSAIVLVPEISLTPQTVERFRSRFDHAGGGGVGVAVLHSHLTEAERREAWLQLQRGEARIAIGARSAVFAPMANLGLIIVDEEHENTYKQEETPRYHARDVAVMRGMLEGCSVLLGSATPSIESYRNAVSGKYRLLELPRRADGQVMPLIRVVDLRLQGKRAKSDGGLSAPLQMAITRRLELDQQTILFLNRRGFATAMLCERCGHVCKCPNCSLAMTFHRAAERLACHLCGHTSIPPSRCPECGDPGIRHSGIGTQRVEESIRKSFPKARIARMDADTMTRRGSYEEVLGKFRARQIDILVGTQMIAKGLDFPNVTLVGIINADIGLHSPDFRAGERTFQLLTQVAGRAGRGETEGEVIVQTFSPGSPSLQHARHHDFSGFYEQEIAFREAFQHPPFSRMLMVRIRSFSAEKASRTATLASAWLREKAPPSVEVSEAALAPLEKSHGQYRYHVILKAPSGVVLGRLGHDLASSFKIPEKVVMTLDVDPYSMM